jgi:ribosomal protein L7Ae-like RNA K-turn-binding protein
MLETDHALCKEIKGNIKEFFQNEQSSYKLSYGIETLLNELEKDNELFG